MSILPQSQDGRQKQLVGKTAFSFGKSAAGI